MIRHGTDYAETIEVKRTFMHPGYRFPSSYNDIAISELGRRVIFDFDTYGDSPMCTGDTELLDGKTAIVQGFGLTEQGKQPKDLLQTEVYLVSNEKCAQTLRNNISNHLIFKKRAKESLEYGIIDQILCSIGFQDKVTGNFSVRFLFF